jgi:membrane protein
VNAVEQVRDAGRGLMAARRIASDKPVRETAEELVKGFKENDLLTYASAISFQIISAMIPFALFVLGLIGFFDLNQVWKTNLAPDVQANVSPAAFSFINDTVNRVLAAKQLFWVTLGAGVFLWELSGATRAVMGVFDNVYCAERERPFWQRMRISFALALAVSACFLAALVVVRFMPLLWDGHHLAWTVQAAAFVLRWAVAAGLMLLAVGLLVHYAPATPQPLRWVSFGSTLVIGSWILMSIGFGFYLREIATYDSIFGNLASVFVLISYLYLSSVVLVAGVQLDAIVRKEVKGTASGVSR